MIEQKRCPKCGEIKPFTHFNRSSKTQDGLAPRCRACVNASRRASTKPGKKQPTKKSTKDQLIAAVKKGDGQAVRHLFRKATNIHVDDILLMAILSHGPRKQSKLLGICNFLLSSGANPNAYCYYGPMMCLATTGVGAYGELLKRHGAKADICSAAAMGDVNGVQSRLHRSPSLAITSDKVGKTPLHYCAGSKLWKDNPNIKELLIEVAKLLLDAYAKVDKGHAYHTDPFFIAATESGNIDLVKLLLPHVDSACVGGLLWGSLRSMNRQNNEFSKISELALANGVNINGGFPENTYLNGHARHEDVQATAWLLSHGANPNSCIVDGRTPLHSAADRNSHTKVVEMLLDHGADINAKDNLGNTALFYAQQSEKQRVVQFLEARLKRT
jgi:hypothetical protein